MKTKNPLFVVRDMEKAKTFYREVLGLRVTADLGVNVMLTGGLSLQTRESWLEFIEKDESQLHFGGNDGEMYFEEEDFDGFVEKLKKRSDITYVHPVKEHSWGQRVVRITDCDGHILEIGEDLGTVCRRFIASGLTLEQTAERMCVPLRAVKRWANEN